MSSPNNNIVVLQRDELQELIESTIQQTRRQMQPLITEAIRQARYGPWVRAAEAMEIMKCSRSHLHTLRTKDAIEWRAKGKVVYYKTDSLYEYMEQLGVN